MAKAPTRDLLVMRHGKSDHDAGAARDFDRPLAGRGRRDAERMGRWLRERRLRPDLVVASPAIRARDTADLVVDALDLDRREIRREPRLYDAKLKTILRLLGEVPETAMRVLVVGHNPGLEDLVLHLGIEDVEEPDDGKLLPTAAVVRFTMPADWRRLEEGAGTLRWIARPRDVQ
jgi:phosphohistidine phosphatase